MRFRFKKRYIIAILLLVQLLLPVRVFAVDLGSAAQAPRFDEVLIKNLKQALVDGYNHFQDSIDISRFGVAWDELREAYSQVVVEYPELFFIAKDKQFGYTADSERGIIASVQPFYIWPAEEIPQHQAAYEAAVQKAMTVINEDMTIIEKALALHDYVVTTSEYDYDTYITSVVPSTGYTAYGIFLDKKAVCEGYALAILELYRRAGIECIVIGSDSMNHAWNLIQVDGNWYHVDSTWDDLPPDKKGRANHTYFMLSDETISAISPPHYNWDADAPKATDKSYEQGFWNGVVSEMIYRDGYWYYTESSGVKEHQISRYSFATGQKEIIKQMNIEWSEIWAPGIHVGVTPLLTSYKDRLYYNTNDSIKSVALDGSDETNFITIEPSDEGWIYGLYVMDNYIVYEVSRKPDSPVVHAKYRFLEPPQSLPNDTIIISDTAFDQTYLATKNPKDLLTFFMEADSTFFYKNQDGVYEDKFGQIIPDEEVLEVVGVLNNESGLTYHDRFGNVTIIPQGGK